ncbi:MAG: radical SAM protein [Candidatus Riflebacteria bacterium]|nr:radical SAM protein [Candidatus Riflebacteria bacterium]
MKKVLLINPYETEQDGFTNPPLGLLYLAGALLPNGFDVRIVDGCREGREAVISALRDFQPHLVGITCLTPGRHKAIDAARMAKELVAGCRVIFGGAHPTIMWRQMLVHYNDIDVIVIGEGEGSLLEIAQGRELSSIPGIAFRGSDGIPRQTSVRPLIQNLDQIHFPAWHLIDIRKYQPRGNRIFRGIDLSAEPRISIIYSRGCTGHCDFCSTWWIWRGWRHRSPGNMVDEIELLYNKYGVRHFCFADDAMTVNREATIQLCNEIIARKLSIAFHVTTRTDCVDIEMLKKLKAAGCYTIAFGIETGSSELLASMGKENEIQRSISAIKWCRKVGIPVTALIIIGNVGENEKTLSETMDFLKKTHPDEVGCVGGLWILPGTKLYRDCRARGLIDDDFWLSDEPFQTYCEDYSLDELRHLVKRFVCFKSILRRVMDKLRRWSRR